MERHAGRGTQTRRGRCPQRQRPRAATAREGRRRPRGPRGNPGGGKGHGVKAGGKQIHVALAGAVVAQLVVALPLAAQRHIARQGVLQAQPQARHGLAGGGRIADGEPGHVGGGVAADLGEQHASLAEGGKLAGQGQLAYDVHIDALGFDGATCVARRRTGERAAVLHLAEVHVAAFHRQIGVEAIAQAQLVTRVLVVQGAGKVGDAGPGGKAVVDAPLVGPIGGLADAQAAVETAARIGCHGGTGHRQQAGGKGDLDLLVHGCSLFVRLEIARSALPRLPPASCLPGRGCCRTGSHGTEPACANHCKAFVCANPL